MHKTDSIASSRPELRRRRAIRALPLPDQAAPARTVGEREICRLEEVAAEKVNDTANKLLDFLRLQGKASRTEIVKVCFKGGTCQ